MKKLALFLLTPVLFVGLVPFSVYAHDLIPQPLQDYVIQHPNATPEEIKTFVDAQDPAYAKKFKNGEEILAILQNQQTSVLDNSFDFLHLGAVHILSGPDHILFVLTLLLVFATLGELLVLTSTFTVGHTVTLILSATGLLVVSPRISEPLIALSIVFMAVTTVFFRENAYIKNKYAKPAIVFFFSLFHGLGFAGLLKEIQIPEDKFLSSLFSFNIGIEIGQLIIIACALPFIFFLRKYSWYPTLIKFFTICITGLALYWVAQRMIGI